MSWGYTASKIYYGTLERANSFAQVFNPSTAKQWYAQQSQNLVSSGHGNWIMNAAHATFYDIAGGYTAMWTGSPASQHQALASVAFSVPTFGFGGAVGSAFSNTQQFISAFSAINTSINSIATHTPVSNAHLQLLGLAGNAAGNFAKGLGWAGNAVTSGQAVAQTSFLGAGNQFNMFFNTARPLAATNWARVSYAISSFRFGNKVGDALNSGTPQVGGVLFDHCDAVLTDVAELTGAYWDSQTNSLVLLGRGRSGFGAASMALPAMDEDLVRLALRAAVAGLPLGVSIDPPAEFRYGKRRHEFPPLGTPLLVSYLGDSSGTLGGAIMFESDRIMKCLSIGMDNETSQPFGAQVAGYVNTLDASVSGGSGGVQAWHRFWFVVDRVELKRDPISGGLTFSDARIKVMCEQEPDQSGQPGCINPVDAQFADHLTRFYDQYAADYPVLARLKELAKIMAVCKLIVGRGVPLDAGSLFHAPPMPVATPATTPSITRTITLSNGSATQHHSMCGGVDLAVDPVILEDTTGSVSALRHAAGSARPGRAKDWSFTHGGAAWQAKAVDLLAPARPARRLVVDHRFLGTSANHTTAPIFLQRIYDSSRLRGGEFGPGWHVHLPFQLRVVRNAGKHPEVRSPDEAARHSDQPKLLVLRDTATGQTGLYRPVGHDAAKPQVQAFCLVSQQDLTPDGVSFQYDSSKQIVRHGDRFHLQREGVTYEFDANGQLELMREDSRCLTRWQWREGRLARIEDAQGLAYECHYEDPGVDRITRITAPDGEVLRYQYGATGLLCEFAVGAVPYERYDYDLADRLVQSRNAAGVVTDRAVYDAAQNVMSSTSEETVPLAGGGRLRRRVVQGRVQSLEDDCGTCARCAYDAQGRLSNIIVTDLAGTSWSLHYEARGRLHRVVLPGGQTIVLRTDRGGRVDRVTTQDGRAISLQRDEQGRPIAFNDSAGAAWEVAYNMTSGTIQFRNDANDCVQLCYSGPSGGLKRFRNGKTKFDDFGNLVTLTQPTPDGGWVETLIQPRQRRTRVIEPGGRRTTSVGPDGVSVITRSRAGKIRVGQGGTADEVIVTFLG